MKLPKGLPARVATLAIFVDLIIGVVQFVFLLRVVRGIRHNIVHRKVDGENPRRVYLYCSNGQPYLGMKSFEEPDSSWRFKDFVEYSFIWGLLLSIFAMYLSVLLQGANMIRKGYWTNGRCCIKAFSELVDDDGHKHCWCSSKLVLQIANIILGTAPVGLFYVYTAADFTTGCVQLKGNIRPQVAEFLVVVSGFILGVMVLAYIYTLMMILHLGDKIGSWCPSVWNRVGNWKCLSCIPTCFPIVFVGSLFLLLMALASWGFVYAVILALHDIKFGVVVAGGFVTKVVHGVLTIQWSQSDKLSERDSEHDISPL